MKIKVWGARGSTPSPLKPNEVEEKICQAIFGMPAIDTRNMETIREYVGGLPPLIRGTAGGNTSCVQIEMAQETFIIDAGSGLRELGLELMKGPCGRGKGKLHLFFSHPHWDHIQGFPFFVPAFIPGNRICIYSIHDLRLALTDQQRFLNFPVPLSYMQADMEFISLKVGEPFSVGSVRINTIENAHPGQAYGFRFEDRHSIFVYANDAEYKQLDEASVQPHIDFFRNADALIFDAQYTLKEAWQKEDWGHSSALIGVDLARAAGVKRLLLFHHDPTYSDHQLQQIEAKARAYQAEDATLPTCEVMIAYEGLTLDLTPPGTVDLQLTSEGEAAVLTPTSIFDERGIGQLEQKLTNLTAEESPEKSIIDLSQVETLTTASLRALVALYWEQGGAQVILANPSSSAQKVIELSDYSDLFAIYSSVEAALAALQAREALNLPGHLIKGRYQIIEHVDEGRLGTTLKATDIHLKHTVALKILSPTFSERTIDRFLRQVRQIISLDHRHIVKVFEADIDETYAFIVEEFIAGQTLQDLLADREKPISPDQAIDIAVDIALALEYAHSRRALHGDIKPRNIFLTDQGIKLSDFGLGRLEEGHNLLDAPLLFLTAGYLAPEQIQGEPIDARTDLYALGAILYELFTGHLPFSGSEQEIVQAHVDQERQVRPPRELNPHISISLEHLILKLLAKNPNDRYASAQQVRRILSNLIVGMRETTRQRRQKLVGREGQMQALRARWTAAQAGRGQLAFISGEPGVGKTSLAQQVAAQSDTSVLLTGHCQELVGSSAYHLFAEILQAYLAIVPPEFFDEEIQLLLANFVQLIPEFGQAFPNLPMPPPLEPKQEQLRLITSLTQFIERATDRRPWFLILDDLQWVDQSSLEVLRYLGRHLPSMRLLIIGTYRDTDLGPEHPLRQVLDDLSRRPTYGHFPLDRLDQEGVNQVLGNLWQQGVPPAICRKIYQHTAGNPLYVEELARDWVDEGLITLRDGEWQFPEAIEARLPENIHEAVWRRTRRLSPDAQTLLRRAAVLGRIFRFEDLKAMIGLSEWQVLEHLDMALERQLIEEAPAEGLLRFSHVEIQSILYEDLDIIRRRLLHRQAGEVLEERLQANPERLADELARHFSEAGDFKKGFAYGLQAARQAKLNYANETALLWYDRSLKMLERLNQDEATQLQSSWVAIQSASGEVLTLLGRYDEALEHYASAHESIESETGTTDQARRLSALYCQTAEVYERRSEYERAFWWLERAFAQLGEGQPTIEAARIYLLGVGLYRRQGNNEEAIIWCQKSLDMVSEMETPEGKQVVAQVYYNLGGIYTLQGDFERAIQFCLESEQIYRQLEDVVGVSQALINLGNAYNDQGNWSQAGQVFQKSLKMKREIGDVVSQGMIANNLGTIYLHRGLWTAARHLFEQSNDIWSQVGAKAFEAVTLSNLAQVHLQQGNWPEAGRCLRRSEALFTEVGSTPFLPELERRWGEFYLKTDDLDQAEVHLSRSIELAVEQGNPLEEGLSRRVLGELHQVRGEQTEAEAALRQSLQILAGLQSKYETAKTQLALARLALEVDALDALDEIQAHLTQSIGTFETLGAQAELAAAQVLKGQLGS